AGSSSSSSPTDLVAIKRISLSRVEELVCGGQTLEDPFQEVRVAAKIAALGNHDPVVRYFASYFEDDHLCLVMEFCNGGDLLHSLERRLQTQTHGSDSLGELEALRAVAQVAQSLDFLHHRVGVAHRDVSLENVFVHNGACKLGDFGLSVAASSRPSEAVGKKAYMAPEVVATSTAEVPLAYDPCSADVWSLGVVFFMLLTGSPLVEVASMDHAPFRAFCRGGDVRHVLKAWEMLDGIEHSETLDLLSAMLQVDPAKRIGIQGILRHPAFTGRAMLG
ncbi:hypothetical protein Gpo141_00014879, partial [Globisporangium polare]